MAAPAIKSSDQGLIAGVSAPVRDSFFDAIAEDDTDLVESMLIKTPNLIRTTKLGAQYYEDDIVLAHQLLGETIGPLSPFQYALLTGSEATALLLALRYCEPEDLHRRWGVHNTNLHLAAFSEMTEVVSLLLARGAECYVRNRRGHIPIDCALSDSVRQAFFANEWDDDESESDHSTQGTAPGTPVKSTTSSGGAVTTPKTTPTVGTVAKAVASSNAPAAASISAFKASGTLRSPSSIFRLSANFGGVANGAGAAASRPAPPLGSSSAAGAGGAPPAGAAANGSQLTLNLPSIKSKISAYEHITAVTGIASRPQPPTPLSDSPTSPVLPTADAAAASAAASGVKVTLPPSASATGTSSSSSSSSAAAAAAAAAATGPTVTAIPTTRATTTDFPHSSTCVPSVVAASAAASSGSQAEAGEQQYQSHPPPGSPPSKPIIAPLEIASPAAVPVTTTGSTPVAIPTVSATPNSPSVGSSSPRPTSVDLPPGSPTHSTRLGARRNSISSPPTVSVARHCALAASKREQDRKLADSPTSEAVDLNPGFMTLHYQKDRPMPEPRGGWKPHDPARRPARSIANWNRSAATASLSGIGSGPSLREIHAAHQLPGAGATATASPSGKVCLSDGSPVPPSPVASPIGSPRNRRIHFEDHHVYVDAIRFAPIYETLDDNGDPVPFTPTPDFKLVRDWIASRRASPNDQSFSGLAALHYAAEAGDLDFCKFLIQHGADPNIYDVDGWTPLHTAALMGHLEVIRFLVEECNADAGILNNENKTAYDEAEDPDIKAYLSPLYSPGAGSDSDTEAESSAPEDQIAAATAAAARMLHAPSNTGLTATSTGLVRRVSTVYRLGPATGGSLDEAAQRQVQHDEQQAAAVAAGEQPAQPAPNVGRATRQPSGLAAARAAAARAAAAAEAGST
ncbi:hypothetical protein H696_00728 [Fonticula alba]|uniref:Uncharacterized protein n=1 Tax=Fonticula alba TaxID=691883 RepID=A0A058ZFL9_FONAL|nr:hypothetical protein H696_00728 [Fonticula alba]KCV73185.1 hypothetical protein H696_00728 [Fonticula alba]|eukprot:XP_009492886.1 hypothetical protein H696_00728 [Fonticula alba]